MGFINTLSGLIAAFMAYGFAKAGFEWYYVLLGAFMTFSIMSFFIQLGSNLFDNLLKKTKN